MWFRRSRWAPAPVAPARRRTDPSPGRGSRSPGGACGAATLLPPFFFSRTGATGADGACGVHREVSGRPVHTVSRGKRGAPRPLRRRANRACVAARAAPASGHPVRRKRRARAVSRELREVGGARRLLPLAKRKRPHVTLRFHFSTRHIKKTSPHLPTSRCGGAGFAAGAARRYRVASPGRAPHERASLARRSAATMPTLLGP